MVGNQGWIPEGVPLEKPSAARIYDCMLGGYHNFEADRAVADKMIGVFPEIRLSAQVNRAFLRRAVTYIVEQGIDQILDLGSGIPTLGNVHEVAQAINPAARVVYVDIDPVAVAHSRAMLEDNAFATAIRADVREPELILENPEVRERLDFQRPVGLLLVTVLHYIREDQEAYGVVRTLGKALVSGSCIVIAHSAQEFDPPERLRLRELFGMASTTVSRSREQILRFFDGYELVEPGLVYTPLWRPESADDLLIDRPERGFTRAGVAWKRAGPI